MQCSNLCVFWHLQTGLVWNDGIQAKNQAKGLILNITLGIEIQMKIYSLNKKQILLMLCRIHSTIDIIPHTYKMSKSSLPLHVANKQNNQRKPA